MASATAHYATLDLGFWKSLCSTHVPWAWELWRGISQETAPAESEIDFKRLYLCLDKNTSQPFGMTVPMINWMGLTNRRRIWDVCLQLLEHYYRVLRETAPGEATSVCSPGISQKSIGLMVFPVAYPQPPDDAIAPVRTYLLHSWQELESSPAVFEAYWDSQGDMVGLGVSFRSGKRILGRGTFVDGHTVHNIKSAGRIAANDWIRGLVVYIRVARPLRDTAVRGVSVCLRPKSPKRCANTARSFSSRGRTLT